MCSTRIVPFLVAGVLLSLSVGCSESERIPNTEASGLGELIEKARIDGQTELLVPIRGLLVNDSLVVVGQPQSFNVRFFDHDGKPIGTFGREGSGPGEFSRIETMGWRADTIWVFDVIQQRISYISADGELLRTESMPRGLRAADQVAEPPLGGLAIPVGLGPDQISYVSFALPLGPAQPPPFDDSLLISRMLSDGTLDRFVSQAPRGRVSVTTATGSASLPFPVRGFVAVSPTAERFVEAFAPLEGTDGGIVKVAMRDGDGVQLWAHGFPVALVPLPKEVADSAVAARLEELQDPDLRRAFRDEYQPPAHYPPIEDLVLGSDGTLWIVGVADRGFRHHLAVDSSGGLIGRVLVPRDGRVRAGNRGSIWVIEHDEFNVESLVRYSVEWYQS